MTETTADAWLAAWEAQAVQDGLERGLAYWQAAWDWIPEQRKARKVAASESGCRAPVTSNGSATAKV